MVYGHALRASVFRLGRCAYNECIVFILTKPLRAGPAILNAVQTATVGNLSRLP